MKARQNVAVAAIAIVAASMMMVGGCGQHKEKQELPEPVQRSRVIVESHLSQLDEVMVEAAQKKALRQAVTKRIEDEAERPFLDRVDDGLRYSTVFSREYIENDQKVVFADQWGLTGRGEQVLAVLDDAWRHNIEAETLHIDRIKDGRSVLVEAGAPPVSSEAFSPTVDEVEALVRFVAGAIGDDDETGGEELLIEAVSMVDELDDALPGLERFREFNRREAAAFEQRAQKMAHLELWVADGALRYARQMRHKNLKRVDWRQMRDAGGSAEIIFARMQDTLRSLAQASPGAVDDVFRGLEPSHRQYRRLLAATDRYREIVDAGGWQRVQSFAVERGAASERVQALRERLDAEGFSASPEEAVDEASDDETDDEASSDEAYDPRIVDDLLLDAIREYQRTHQFVADASPTPGFWRSINVSAERRLRQMELTLQRWRESHLEDDKNYILVNIPRFKTQVWTDGELRMEFSVVVGNNQRRCNQDEGVWEYPDATPVLMSELDHLMLNPPWYVPERLVRETLEPRVAENEDYYEEQGYEEIELADGRTAVRQLPGEGNALGRVKFIFPNEHNVYLHDTPHQQYFDYGIRSFSHGCVRVSKPLELAEFLLQWEGRDDIDIDEVLESQRTRKVDFERTLPVMTEYYTVWVDDEGYPHFLADIYKKDARRLSDEPEEFDQCTPRAGRADEEPQTDEGEDEVEPEEVDADLGP